MPQTRFGATKTPMIVESSSQSKEKGDGDESAHSSLQITPTYTESDSHEVS